MKLFKRKEKSLTIKDNTINIRLPHCYNCLSTKFYEGPSGGLSINIKCAECGLWYNYTPFGIDFLGINDIGEHKKIMWYCIECKKIFSYIATSVYPKCCGTNLKVCWSCDSFPKEFCNNCEERFLCYTERNN